jgi:hypothetical protein
MYLPRGTPVHYLGSQIVILSLFDMHHADDRARASSRGARHDRRDDDGPEPTGSSAP